MTTTRYFPVGRAAGVEEGLAARLADPLWLLARQWQLGEFRGDDAGSATSVTVAGVAHHPTWWRPEPDADQPAAHPWQPWTVADGPLERLIEAEPDTGAAYTRLRIDAGVRARRLLVTAGLASFAAKLVVLAPWPAQSPSTSDPVDALAKSATADGDALAALIGPWSAQGSPVPPQIVAALGGTDAQITTFANTMRTWFGWWSPRAAATRPPAAPGVPPDPPAWDPHRLEHRGTLAFAAAPTLRLQFDRYPGGGVDWYAADAADGQPADLPATPVAAPFAAPQPVSETGVPLPTSFAGMPAPRFWEFEDATVDFGSIDASPADLARLLLVEFTTVYGNDWFAIPLRLPAGALVRIDTVSVSDSFGGVEQLGPFAATSAGWRVYSLAAPAERPELALNYFWCAPTLSKPQVSPAVERATLRRDEMAETAWAVVEYATDDAGRSYTVPNDKAAMPAVTDPPQYLVETPVAANWYPVVPQPIPGRIDAYQLVLEALVRRAGGQIVETRPPGVVLAAPSWWIHEEELGRAGLTLDRRVRLARWHDGTRHRWIGRSVWPGTGEASSGLLWDVVVE